MPDQEITDTSSTTPTPVPWQDHIPADLKDKPYWGTFKDSDLSGVLQSFGHAQERLGKSITLPDSADDKEGWAKVGEKLRPATVDGYQAKLPEVEGAAWDEAQFEWFKKVAYDNGLRTDQFTNIVDAFTQSRTKAYKDALDQGLERAAVTQVKLQKELGTNFDMQLALAKRAGNLYFGQEVTESIVANMNEPALRGLMKLGKQLMEDGVFGSNPPESQGITTKEEALKRIAQIGSDRTGPYWSRDNTPAKQAAVKEMEDLHKIAFPTA